MLRKMKQRAKEMKGGISCGYQSNGKDRTPPHAASAASAAALTGPCCVPRPSCAVDSMEANSREKRKEGKHKTMRSEDE